MIMLKESKKKQPDSSVVKLLEALESHTKLLAFIFGLCFVGILLALAVWFPQPTAFQYTVFRITLALAAAGVAGVIPGMIRLKFQPNTMLLIHAGGALAVFVIVYFIAPAALRSELPAPTSQQNNGGVNQIINNSHIGAVNNTVNHYGLTKEQYEEWQRRLIDELAAKLQNADAGQRALLERQLQAVREKLADTEKSYAEDLKKRKAADEALVQMKGQLPDEQIKKAKASLEQGETAAAEKAFDAVVDKEGGAVALAAYQSGQLAEGRLDYDKALRQYKKAVMLEENNPEYLYAVGEMAWIMGEYKQAEDWCVRLLKIREQGKDDAKLGIALNNLALMYEKQGHYSEAEPLYKRSLVINEKSLGKDHPSMAVTLNNLATLYYWQGHYLEAEPLYKRSLEIKEKAIGKDHPDVATTLNNLAEIYRAQGRYSDAEPLCKRSLEIQEENLGKDHPDVATTLNNLAEIYRAQGRYSDAEPLYKRSLEIKEKALGKDHPDVATILNNMANLYKSQGKYKESKPMYEQAITIMKKKFLSGHPNLDLFQKNYDALKCKIAE